MTHSAPLASVVRGPMTESLHHGSIALTDDSGILLAALGNPYRPTFARSSAKPLQAIPVVESGALEQYGFTEEELALMCASHNGEPEHVRTASAMMAKLGLPPESMQCGAHDPYYGPAAEQLKKEQAPPTCFHNNCSGKHAGMLALARQLNVPAEDYTEPGHPVQLAMRQAVAEMAALPADRLLIGTDGCSVPVFGLPLASLAAAFARLGTGSGLSPSRAEACSRIVAAIRRHPFLLAGTDRFDTRLIEVTRGRILGKMGAEAVFALTVPESGIGLAVKVEDGNQRALYPAVVEALLQLDLLSAEEAAVLRSFHRPDLTNWKGMKVGRIEPEFKLERLAL